MNDVMHQKRARRILGDLKKVRSWVLRYEEEEEKLFNSKVIKSFVPELRIRKCFSCFGIPMFYVYMLWTVYVRYTGRLHVTWVCYIDRSLKIIIINSWMDPKEILLLQVWVDLGVMAIKTYSKLYNERCIRVIFWFALVSLFNDTWCLQ